MKKVYYISLTILAVTLLSFSLIKCGTKTENKKTETFLKEMTDARLMDREEGREAVKKGTTEEIRNYGELMIKDQTYLLEELQKFATTKNVMLPTQISEEKQSGLKELKEKTGKDLDEKFLNMICIDHKRDVRKFKEATESKDIQVSAFAAKNLPMIESHLRKVKELKGK